MKKLTIEWRHLESDGTTCDRCGETGRMLRNIVPALRRSCRRCGVAIKFVETTLPASRLNESNVILFNNVPLEKALGDAEVGPNECGSCSTLLGKDSKCRSVERAGSVHEAIPPEWIWEAAGRVAGCQCGEFNGTKSRVESRT